MSTDTDPDIFEFWKDVGPTETVHPADLRILSDRRHNFQLECLPVPFYGPLKTARIVLLFTNPGYSAKDVEQLKDKAEQQFYWEQRQGTGLLRSQVSLKKKSWWVSRTKRICSDPEFLRDKLAVLELCAYHSADFKDGRLLSELPSCKVALNWAQNVLFPRAKSRQLVVICLRAARRWGLAIGKVDGYLFAPDVTRPGYMKESQERAEILEAARIMLVS
jgi:hypothetical protein